MTLNAIEIFEQALDQPAERRLDWLRTTHGADPDLVAQVERLLAVDADATRRLPTLVPEPPEPGPFSDPPPERVGAYRLTDPLGEGGMGVVWRGERDDGLFEHVVAVKFAGGPGMHARALERFAVERRALARLVHPNIARLLDGGVTIAGRPYIIMELVEGRTITDHVIDADLDARGVVRLFLPVLAAVNEAHRKLVAHGDIKPSNVMVRTDGEPRVLDFGVARLLDPDLIPDETERGPLTAAYASPSRRENEPPGVADDVYALGILLRELLTRRGPTLGEDGPARPLDADLEAVVDHATEAEAGRRYDGAAAMADDLTRWLETRPVLARGGGWLYRTRRLLARRPLASAAVVAAALGLIVTAGAMTSLYLRAETERQEAELRFTEARGMARYMLIDLFDDLNQTPGTIAVRRELVATSQDYLERLSRSPHATPSVRADAIMGYVQLAGVMGLYAAGDLGDRDSAREMLARAERLASEPPPGAADDPDWRHAVGRLRLFQGFFALAIEDRGPEVVAARLREAETELEASLRLAPDRPLVLADLWETRLNQADALISAGDHAGAARVIEAELAAWPARERPMANEPKTAALRALSFNLLGDARYYLDDLPGSFAAYQEGVRVIEAENTRRPGRTRTLSVLADLLTDLAGDLDEMGRGPEAIDTLSRAAGIARDRLAVEPDNAQMRRRLIVTESDLANLQSRLGRHAQALSTADRLETQIRADLRAKPDDIIANRLFLATLRPIADTRREAGRHDEACRAYRELRDGWAAFQQRFQVNTERTLQEIQSVDERLSECR